MTEQRNADALTIYLDADAAYAEAVDVFLASDAAHGDVLDTFLTAQDAFTAAVANLDVAKTIAPTLGCEMVTVIAEMLEKEGHDQAAEWWLVAHAAKGDLHELDPHADYRKEV
ncbi:hypothetical protein MT349_19090 [Rathayibacter caricis]|uniref:hypothetical protein n=1 Tax=Rathayibacter caricis TaxID=110936 RepID=UPI001FB4CC3B|nr:hypothetical protein [Rathayibacter caricis]MCJ1697894.1 hypothetical protein [Rathayibacter caricis]